MYTSRCTLYSSADRLDVKECSSWEVEERSIGPPNRLLAATKGAVGDATIPGAGSRGGSREGRLMGGAF